MKVKPYDKVSSIYDGLMRKLDYASWSNYIMMIAKEFSNHDLKILELGSGKCQIAKKISDHHKNYFATDLSLSMLLSSQQNHLKKVCCDMTILPFKTKFNFIFSAFDSINYILKQKSLLQLFSEVNRVLEDNGIFTFDVSLENNSLNFIKSQITEGYYNSSSYKMLSKYNRRSRIHSNKFYIWNDSGEKYTELHKEKIYELDTYFKISEKAGLQIITCYDCFSFENIRHKSMRAQFVMRKIIR